MSDLISREAAMAAINEYMVGKRCDTDGTMMARLINELVIKQLPPAELGTNLATHGTDCISRQAAIDAINCNITITGRQNAELVAATIGAFVDRIKALPSAQPEIIRCRECKFASGDSRICMKFDHSPIGELDFCSFAERREVNYESN